MDLGEVAEKQVVEWGACGQSQTWGALASAPSRAGPLGLTAQLL